MDVAVATQVVQHDMNTSALGDPVGLLSGINEIFLSANREMNKVLCEILKEKNIHYVEGIIATGDLFLHKPETKEKIHNRFEAIAGEMEGASIGQVCYLNKVPFVVLRTISDDASGHAPASFEAFAGEAAVLACGIVRRFAALMEG